MCWTEEQPRAAYRSLMNRLPPTKPCGCHLQPATSAVIGLTSHSTGPATRRWMARRCRFLSGSFRNDRASCAWGEALAGGLNLLQRKRRLRQKQRQGQWRYSGQRRGLVELGFETSDGVDQELVQAAGRKTRTPGSRKTLCSSKEPRQARWVVRDERRMKAPGRG